MDIKLPQRDIRQLNLDELKTCFMERGDKPYRAEQVYAWLWKKSVTHFDDMTNLSVDTRNWLKKHFVIRKARVADIEKSEDQSVKARIRLADNLSVESVLIPHKQRVTACISSQVGCSLACVFCATARLRRQRNLSVDEIYDQVVEMKEQSILLFKKPLTNIVFMGMGEPLLNYSHVMTALDRITSPQGLHMAPRRITISTAGLPKMIKKMADDEVKCNLAVSLHSAIDDIRTKLMPINTSNSLKQLMESLTYWYSKTERKVTFEYIVWEGINDTMDDVRALLRYCKQVPCKVNLIEYNPIGEDMYRQAKESVWQMYQEELESSGITTRIRRSRGRDIQAACGQLATQEPL